MKIVQINTTCGVGSTGKISLSISELLNSQQIENYIISSSPCNYEQGINCGLGGYYTKLQALKSRILGNYGFNSSLETKKIIRTLERIQPDIVHLHNIHGHDCNIEYLFNYLNKQNINVVWTFHDCWAITGYCPHFAMIGCENWKSGCGNCPLSKKYSWFFDFSARNLERKKNGIASANLTIVTPSQWLADLVGDSIASGKPTFVVNNGIDLSVFKPTESNFRQSRGIGDDKFVILGVADIWNNRKGLDVFIELSEKLERDKYVIVLVGTDSSTEALLPESIISVRRTQSQRELAEIYTAADLFVNPTREEALGLVNIESLACGTPVLTFRTGGSPECIDETCGSVVECNDIAATEMEIRRITAKKPYSPEACRKRAQKFDKKDCAANYLKVYQQVSSER